VRWTTTLNRVGMRLASMTDVHAVTDVTGFGLAGHLLEICRASRLGAVLRFADVPLIERAAALAREGVATGASARNWQSYGDALQLAPDAPAWQRTLLTDPQTSGGLLIACAAAAVPRVLAALRDEQGDEGYVIGGLHEGAPLVRVDASTL
jgi:selenide, water dikinase